MILGDMFTFSIIYSIMLFGFTQAFYFLYKRDPSAEQVPKYSDYLSTWMASFHMTLGDYDVSITTLNPIKLYIFSISLDNLT